MKIMVKVGFYGLIGVGNFYSEKAIQNMHSVMIQNAEDNMNEIVAFLSELCHQARKVVLFFGASEQT